MFVGFDEDYHAHKVFCLESGKIIFSRDIKAYPEKSIDFEENDWSEPFPVENENNWFSGQTHVPKIYEELFYNFPESENTKKKEEDFNPVANNNNNIINNNQKEREIIQNEGRQNIQNEGRMNEREFEEREEDIMGNYYNNRPEKERKAPFTRARPFQLRSKGPPDNSNKVLMCEYINNLINESESNIETPTTYKEAMESIQKEEWKKSIKEEQESLIKLDTFEVVPREANQSTVKSKYVFKVKTNEKGEIERFKTRLVAKGYTQKEGVDFKETFSPTLRLESLRYLISLAKLNGFQVNHLDVQTAFLNGELEEDIFMEIPEGFDEKRYNQLKQVFKLKKSLYGLKQASRVWNLKFTSTITRAGLVQSTADPCIFFKFDSNQKLLAIVGIFVDDCFVAGGDKQIKIISDMLMSNFEMHNLGKMSFILGIKIEQNNEFIKLSQNSYITKLVNKFNLADAKIAKTPLPAKFNGKVDERPFDDTIRYQQLIGSLIYLSNATRPDIAYAVGQLARKMQSPSVDDWQNGKRVIRYLKGTINLALVYNSKEPIIGYSDSSYAEEKDRKSVGGYIFKQAGAAISWKSTKQPIIARSSMEAEYIALDEAAKEAQWLKKFEVEIGLNTKNPIIICEDNQSAIKMAKNPIHNCRSKHIDVRYHVIRDLVAAKVIEVKYLETENMTADIMTKSLGFVLHARHTKGLGMEDTQA
jgi:hypothetical protein